MAFNLRTEVVGFMSSGAVLFLENGKESAAGLIYFAPRRFFLIIERFKESCSYNP